MSKKAHHLIDGALHYKGFGSFLEDEGLSERGTDYSVLAVFGGQSTGKSTLLNHLFNTQFQVMDASSGRTQTTQGVWMSRAAGSDRLIVLDFEGTDSRERGEDQSFERKLSLFALAMADVLLINIFQYEIGRRQAMNIPLLETVLEINFTLQRQLAESGSTSRGNKKMLMFVIRDYDGFTPKDVLIHQLQDAMTDIWKKIPNQTEEFDKWFDFHVEFLPNLHHPDFTSAVGTLKEEFVDTSHDTFVFRSSGAMRCCGIPIQDFSIYASGCWEAIKKNKDINIPSQKELVARHRCTEVAGRLKQEFTDKAARIKSELEGGKWVTNIRKMLAKKRDASLEAFYKDTSQFSRYQDVVEGRARELEQELSEIKDGVEKMLYQRICQTVGTAAKSSLAERVNALMKESQDFTTNKVWPKLRNTLNSTIDEKAAAFDQYMKDGVLDTDGLRLCKVQLSEILASALRDLLSSFASTVGDLMCKRFAYALVHTPEGLAVSVKEEQLHQQCPVAWKEGLLVLDCLLVWRMGEAEEDVHLSFPKFDERDDPGKVPVIDGPMPSDCSFLVPKERLQQLYIQYNKDSLHEFNEARLGMLRNKVHLPAWVYIVIAVLGFDEALWVVSNPIIVIFCSVILYLFARQWIFELYMENMHEGPPAVQAALRLAHPYVVPYLDPQSGGAKTAEKSAAAKKND
eukprot:Sspe_Gene.6679::Locus_2249_Transcript_1_1_Confidence_1.000_Length_2127::g.6679::m.6679